MRSFADTLRGRAKGESERLIILAHQTEAMARQRRLHPIDYYLRPQRRSKPGSQAVVAAFKRWEKMGLVKSRPHEPREGN